MPRPPEPTATLEGGLDQTQARRTSSDRWSVEPQSSNYALEQVELALRLSPLELLQTSPHRCRVFASSNRRKASPANRVHHRRPSPSDRFDPALIPGRATSSIVLPWAASFHKLHAWERSKQDGLYVSLT